MYTHTHTHTRIPIEYHFGLHVRMYVFVCIDHIIVVCSHLVVVVHHSVNERACARALLLRALRHTVISPLPPPARLRLSQIVRRIALRNVFTFL